MSIANLTTPSQALASYAAQSQAYRPRSRQPETEPKVEEAAQESQIGDRVTLSAESTGAAKKLIEQALEVPSKEDAVEPTGSNQAVQRKQLDSTQETRSAASKSVARALEAYTQVSLI